MNTPRVSLDQWQILKAVGEEGSFQGAADRLRKSQSTVSYAIHQLQEKLGVTLFEYVGRRAHLTEQGQLVLRRAGQLVEQAAKLEQVATDLARGWEPQVNIVVDAIFPRPVILRVLERFAPVSGGARVELFTETLSGTHELISSRAVSLGICGLMPTGFLGRKILEIDMVAVARADHPLCAIKGLITEQQLREARQIVVRDSGSLRRMDSGWLGAEQRWTVSTFEESLELVRRGLAFAFLPRHLLQGNPHDHELVELPLEMGGERSVFSNLVFTDRENAGPGTLALAELVIEECRHLQAQR